MSYIIYKKIVIPDNERLFIVGDTHGCYDLYKKGIKELGITEKDWVISVGDYIDRGAQNVKMLLEFTKPNRLGVLGNHEALAAEGLTDDRYFECWLENGGDKTLNEVGEDEYPALVEIIKQNFPVILEVEHRGKSIGVVHGGVPPLFDRGFDKIPDWKSDIIERAKLDNRFVENLLWDRDALETNRYEVKRKGGLLPSVSGVDYVFHGHTFAKEPEIYGNRYYIDTGSVFNGHICFCWFEEDWSFEYFMTKPD